VEFQERAVELGDHCFFRGLFRRVNGQEDEQAECECLEKFHVGTTHRVGRISSGFSWLVPWAGCCEEEAPFSACGRIVLQPAAALCIIPSVKELLAYMKAVVEAEGDLLPFVRWLEFQEDVILELLPSDSYIRLKQGDALNEFRSILTRHGIEFNESPDACIPRGAGELLVYMKAVIEGEDDALPFSQWLRIHRDAIEKHFSRGSYLRMRQGDPLSEFRKLLQKQGIEFKECAEGYLPRGPGDISLVMPEWLTFKLFPYRKCLFDHPVETTSVHDFLHMVELKQTGDELWRFASPDCGKIGVALVRDGRVVYAIFEQPVACF
jgi:hypothetical protein